MATAIKPQTAEERTATKGLVRKLCEAGAAVGWIEKSGRNQFYSYNYATEADLVAALRGELYKRGIFIFPHVMSQERKAITVSSRNGERQTALTDVMIRWTFVDGETGEKFECDVPGCGEDSGDKGIYKAMTGSEKYLLMKAFLIPTGDDPEKDSDPEKKEAWQNGKEAAQAVAQRKIGEHAAGKKSSISKVSVLMSGKDGKVYGQGLASLLALLDQHKPAWRADIRWDESEMCQKVTGRAALALQQFCEAHGMECEFVDGATGEVKQPIAPKRAILADGKLGGQLESAEVQKLKQKVGTLLKVRVGEYEASLFDNAELTLGDKKVRAFDELQRSLNQLVEFAVKTNGQYLNITRILRIGCYEWDEEGIPVIQRGAQVNPEVTDSDIPF